jgi:plastocyanin
MGVTTHRAWAATVFDMQRFSSPTNLRRPMGMLLIPVIAAGLVGCSAAPTPAAGVSEPSTASSPNTAHMDNTRFMSDSITISAGESVTLVADTMRPHFVANGTWSPGNSPQPARESGAPEVRNVSIQGTQSGTIGPFTEPGTFQLYCTIHPGMNLTVTVN